MRITLVKKILASGEACRKCQEVEMRLRDAGYWSRIDEVVVADERDPRSPGMELAGALDVDNAPFFIVDRDGERTVYTVYFRFVREVLDGSVPGQQAAAEILANNPDLGNL